MPAHTFDKRIYTPATFLLAVWDLIRHRDDLRLAVRRRDVDRAFAEKLMLVVTEVNRCRYCQVAHTWAARNVGVTEQELLDLRVGNFVGLPARGVAALQFAQHYAQQEGQYDQVAWERVVELWGVEATRQILAYLRAISFGNLLGNTFDALLNRLRGRPASNSSFVAEAAIPGLSAIAVPAGIVLCALWQLMTRACKGADWSGSSALSCRADRAAEVAVCDSRNGSHFAFGRAPNARTATLRAMRRDARGYRKKVDKTGTNDD